MFKVSFNNEAIAQDYINGLIASGMYSVNNISEMSYNSFCVIGNEVYFILAE